MEGMNALVAAANASAPAMAASVTKESIIRDVQIFLDSADEGLRQSSTKLMHKDMELAEVRHQAMQAKMEAVAHKKKAEELVIFVVLHGAGCSFLLCACAVCADCTHFCRNCG